MSLVLVASLSIGICIPLPPDAPAIVILQCCGGQYKKLFLALTHALFTPLLHSKKMYYRSPQQISMKEGDKPFIHQCNDGCWVGVLNIIAVSMHCDSDVCDSVSMLRLGQINL